VFISVFKKAICVCCPSVFKTIFARIKASETGYRLAGGAFWSLIGVLISRGLMFGAAVFIARILGKTGFGELGIIQSTTDMFGVFLGFGLGMAATKYVAEFRSSEPERAGHIIAISKLAAIITGGLLALVFLIFAPWIAGRIISAPQLVRVLRIGSVILFLSTLNGVQAGALSGFEAFKTIAHVNFFVGLVSFPLLLAGVYFWGLTGVVWALAINLCFNWFLNQLVLDREAVRYKIPITLKGCSRELNILWSFSLPAVSGGLIVGFATWVCNTMLVNQPSGYAEMGILTAALIFQGILLFTGSMLNAPLLAMVSNSGIKISEKLGSMNILSTWILGVIVAIPLLCFPELAEIIFNKGYQSYNFKVTFSIVVLCTTIIMFKAGLARMLTAKSLLWWGFFSNTFWAASLIVLNIFLVQKGSSGLAAALLIAYILNTVVFMPLYFFRNLVPKRMLISFESAAIWLVLVILLFLNIIDISLIFRAIAFVPSFTFACIAFNRLMRKGCLIQPQNA
jgi:O-antigen/teichoic acid export membrane protein